MSFEQESNQVPTSIGSIAVTLTDNDGIAAHHIATFVIKVLDQNGNVYKRRTGDLEPHLTPSQETMVVSFLSWLRAEAEDKILP